MNDLDSRINPGRPEIKVYNLRLEMSLFLANKIGPPWRFLPVPDFWTLNDWNSIQMNDINCQIDPSCAEIQFMVYFIPAVLAGT